MRPIHIRPLTPTQRQPLDHLYRTTKTPRLRTRAQMVLLSVDQGLKVPQIAAIVRESEATALRWLNCDRAEGVEGLQDAPRPGRPAQVTAAYRSALLTAGRRRPRSVGSHFPCGPCRVWSITWPSAQAFASRMRRCGAP
jgi:Winged helix-turn helix